MYMARHHSLGGTPKTGANGLGSLEIDRDHAHMINPRANLTRNPVTDKSHQGYNNNNNNSASFLFSSGLAVCISFKLNATVSAGAPLALGLSHLFS